MTDESCPTTRAIGARLATALHRYLAGELDEATLVRGLRRLAADIEGQRVLRVQEPASGEQARAVEVVFGWWQQRCEQPKAKLTPGRRRVVLARLREGYTVEQVKQAISACSASPWHMGVNDRKVVYNDLTLICRSGEKLEAFLALGGGSAEDPEIEVLQRGALQALQEGRTDDYNRTNARISSLQADRRRAAG